MAMQANFNQLIVKQKIVVIGAGPAGLMAAEMLATQGYAVTVVEQKPSAARKFLMAGKTGLNISHNEPLENFVKRYDCPNWLGPMIEQCDAAWIQQWMHDLGIASYVGSSGRIFPNEMKAAPLLRAWLKRLQSLGVTFLYRTQCIAITGHRVHLQTRAAPYLAQHDSCETEPFHCDADAIVLACGALSWPQLGSDGAWQSWLPQQHLQPFAASNVGVLYAWSSFMQPIWGQPLKRVNAWVEESEQSTASTQPLTPPQTAPQKTVVHGDIVVSHYGLESGVIYQLNRDLRRIIQTQGHGFLKLDLLPDVSLQDIAQKLQRDSKQTLTSRWRKLGLDAVKIALLRDVVDKADWSNAQRMAQHIKALALKIQQFRPIAEAISCAGGVKASALSSQLQLLDQPQLFCCGEMLDWDAPTGGYLLTACLATGRVAAQGVHHFLSQAKDN